MNITFGATIKDGKLYFKSRAYFLTRVAKLPQGKYRITLSDTKPKRSGQQNNFLWGVVYPTISEETGNDIDDLHEYAKRKFLPPRFIEINGEEIKVPGSTKDLNKHEFTEYIDKLQAWSGVALPNPEEAGYHPEKTEKIEPIDYPQEDLGEVKF